MTTLDSELLDEIRRQIAAHHEELQASTAPDGLVPLKIACKMSSCRHGRHSLDYLRKAVDGEVTAPGHCRACRRPVVALPGPSGRSYGDPRDLASTLADMQTELIRAHYWASPIDRWAMNQAARDGRSRLEARVESNVRLALTDTGPFASRRAPYSKNIVAYAQHAVAACCRKCAAYWHGLPADSSTPASVEQIAHVTHAAVAYLRLRLPSLDSTPSRTAVLRLDKSQEETRAVALDDILAARLQAGVDPAGLMQSFYSRLVLTDELSVHGGRIRVGHPDAQLVLPC